jgi:ATP-binding cassette subfamily B protein
MGVTPEIWGILAMQFALVVFFCLLNIPVTMMRTKIVSRMRRQTTAGIKSAIVRKLQSLSITYHKDIQTGKIQSKFLKDTDQIDQLFAVFINTILPSIIGAIISAAISVYKNGFVALFFLLVIPVNLLVSFAFRKRLSRGFKDFRIKNENTSNRLSTMLAMTLVTRSHGLEQTEIDSTTAFIQSQATSGMQLDDTNALFGSAFWVVNKIMSVVCLVFCAGMALLGYISAGDIVLYQTMFTTINGDISALISHAPTVTSGMDAIASVSEIMSATDVEVTIGKASVPSIRGEIAFRDAYYTYPNTKEPVIRGLSLSVKAGECIAFVGASGSGKSTIMNMIIGFLLPQTGDVLVDGKNIRDLNLSEYRHHISVVPQNSILFAGTIRENITYGMPRYNESDLNRVIDQANLRELIESLPDGLDTMIGEHGDKLSGGQKQRITIARALIRNPKILILDEATSALDNISEYHVQKAISASIKGRTTFIVAHRLSTIRNADRIVVMEDGVASEIGTYDELMAKRGRFYELKSLNDFNQRVAEDALM